MAGLGSIRRMLASAMQKRAARSARHEVTDDLFAGTQWRAPRHMEEPTEVFHGTRAKIEGDFDPFTHVGTKKSAKDRLAHTRGNSGQKGFGRVHRRRIAPGRQVEIEDTGGSANLSEVVDQLRKRGAIDDADHALIREAIEGEGEKLGAQRALDILNKRGVVALRYKNIVEDPGSISYIVPDSRNLTLGLAGLIAVATGGRGALRTDNAEPISSVKDRRS